MPSENCQREDAKGHGEMSQPVPQARQWESLTYLEQPRLMQDPQRGTGGWELQVWGQGGHEAVHQGCFGPLEEVEVLLRGQAGMGRSSGGCQQGEHRREQQGREENE